MPIYEYRCENCEERFEEFLAASTAPSPRCPVCGSESVARLFSTFATEWRPSIVNWHRMPGKW
jgi:putative FmdB family regulatory protein